ncbi:MAG: sodium:proton exchanger [Alphaproteobacteria bacterium]|nr:sodium:proton exchanger [Alphaproteobacteria bacterium]
MEQLAANHHHLLEVIATLLLFFGIAGLIVPMMHRLKLSPILGYLLCGIAIGPFGLASLATTYPWLGYVTIQDTGTVYILGELGIITLMFMIGLELSFERLRELRRYIFGLGSAQILLTALVIFAIAMAFNNSIPVSILIGASFALSSTAIVLKLLEERKLTSRPVGIICFCILLMQDLAVIPILVLASSFSADANVGIVQALASSLALGILVVVAIYFLGKKVLAPFLQTINFSKSPEWLAAFVVFAVIGSAALTQLAGLSLALGAFMAGLLIAETEYRHEVEVIISPLKSLLIGIFFLSIGMMINLTEVLRQPLLLAVGVVGIFAVKAAILLPLCLKFKVPLRKSVEISLYLSQPGEFALLVLGVATASALMPAENTQYFLLVTACSMMLSPLVFAFTPQIADYVQRRFGKSRQEMSSNLDLMSGHSGVLIAGFGRTGQLLARVLQDQRLPYIAFDNNAELVRQCNRDGYRIIYGDARRKALWHRLINSQIDLAIITIDDHAAIHDIIHSLRAEFPLLPVIVRTKDSKDSNALYDMGAKHVVVETLESSLRLAQLVMESLGQRPEEAKQVVQKIRVQELQNSGVQQAQAI